MKTSTFQLLFVFFCALSRCASGFMTSVEYVATSGVAMSDPIAIPNAEVDLMVQPSISIDSGSFTSVFDSDPAAFIVNGPMSIADVGVVGEIDLEFSSTIEVFGFPVSVVANLAGPLTIEQTADSQGSLIAETQYAETSPGSYNFAAGPLSCSDSAFGVFCGLIQTGLGIEFPLGPIANEGINLPFAAGTFQNVNVSGESSVSTNLELSLPVADENTVGIQAMFTWEETTRTEIVPEPNGLMILATGLLLFSLRKRR